MDTTFDLGQAVGQQQAADTFFQQPQYGAMSDMAVQEPFMPSRDVEAQMGGFYGGVPSQSELARARFAQEQMNQPAPTGLARGAQAVENTAQQFRDLARQYPTVAKMLSTGATTLPTLINAVRARRETEQAAQRLRQLGAPLREQGEALRQQALAGQLSPQEAAAQEAARARLRQGAATRGTTTGTQAAMIENQLGRQRAQLSETKLTNAVKLLNLGNAYDEEAIRLALSGNQRVRNAVANIFANLGQQTASTASPQQEQPVAQSDQRITRRPDTRQG